MTTDTSRAPERIWASEVALFDSGRSAGSYYTDRYSSPAGNEYATEYVHADIHAAMQARAEKAEADKWMERAMGECSAGLGLKAENERLREALSASVEFADWVADQAGIDMDETILTVRVTPEGREVGSKSWAEVQNDARAALEWKEGA